MMRSCLLLVLSTAIVSASAQTAPTGIYIMDAAAECQPFEVFRFIPVFRCTYFQPTTIITYTDPQTNIDWESRIPFGEPYTGEFAWAAAPEMSLGTSQSPDQVVLGGVYPDLSIRPWGNNTTNPGAAGYTTPIGIQFGFDCNSIRVVQSISTPGTNIQHYNLGSNNFTVVRYLPWPAVTSSSTTVPRNIFLSGAHVTIRMHLLHDPVQKTITIELYGHTGQIQRLNTSTGSWITNHVFTPPHAEYLWMRYETFEYYPLSAAGGGGEPQIDYRSWLNALVSNTNSLLNTLQDPWNPSDFASYEPSFTQLEAGLSDITVPGLVGPEFPTGTDLPDHEVPEWTFTFPFRDITEALGWSPPYPDWSVTFDFEFYSPIRLPVHMFCLAMTSIWGIGRVWQELRKY